MPTNDDIAPNEHIDLEIQRPDELDFASIPVRLHTYRDQTIAEFDLIPGDAYRLAHLLMRVACDTDHYVHTEYAKCPSPSENATASGV